MATPPPTPPAPIPGTPKKLTTGIVIPPKFDPTTLSTTLGRDVSSKVDFTRFNPLAWQSYVQASGVDSYSAEEATVLKACFISLNDEKLQAQILAEVRECLYFQVASFHQNGSLEKKEAFIRNQADDNLFDVISGRYESFITLAKIGTGKLLKYVVEAQNGYFKIGGRESFLTVQIPEVQIYNFINSNATFSANKTLASNLIQLFNGPSVVRAEIRAVGKKVDATNANLGTGIAGVTAEVVKVGDLLKSRTQLFTPEQLADPKVQKMLQDQAASDAKLELEKNKQILELNRQLRQAGVFDPLVATLADPNLANQMAIMDQVAKKIVPGNSLNESKFVGPRIKITDTNLNSPLQAIKNSQNLPNLESERKKVGRPKGTTKIAKVNAFIEQRSINRIKNFMNEEEPPGPLRKIDLPKEDFKYLDPAINYNPVDSKKVHKAFRDIDPNLPKEEKITLMRDMMFRPYG